MLIERITHDPAVMGGKPCIRGLRVTVHTMVGLLSLGKSRERILEGARIAAEAGLQLHLTCMVGYPWETREDAYETLALARELMYSGLAHHLQATVVMPYPGTPLFDLCQQNGWIRFEPTAYERYDEAMHLLRESLAGYESRG